MSNNTSKGRRNKGSKFWVQTIINSCMRTELERQIGLGKIKWISPLTEDDCAGYKLNQSKIAELIGIPKESYDFWPSNQPQWDAIGITENTIVLVEAKAHLKELNSRESAKDRESKMLIKETMKDVFDEYYSGGNFRKWRRRHYELGNRLTFLKKLRELEGEDGREVKLVLLNIVNDPTHIATTEEQWEKAYADILMKMTNEKPPLEDVIIVNYHV